jgi:hypothetical protein
MRPLLLAALLAIPTGVSTQAQFEDDSRFPADTTPGRGLLNLGFNHTGISFGNSARWNGLRINIRDRGVQRSISRSGRRPVTPTATPSSTD